MPGAICFYTSGVKMVVEGSPVLDVLQSLESRGVRLIICKTCLDYYGLARKGSRRNLSAAWETSSRRNGWRTKSSRSDSRTFLLAIAVAGGFARMVNIVEVHSRRPMRVHCRPTSRIQLYSLPPAPEAIGITGNRILEGC